MTTPKRIVLLAGATAALLLATHIEAHESHAVSTIFENLDHDDDGLVQFTELVMARQRIFERYDANGDEVLGASELTAIFSYAEEAGRGAVGAFIDQAGILDRMNINRNGVIERQEFFGFDSQQLAYADRNGDGALSLREFRSLPMGGGHLSHMRARAVR